MKKTGWKKQREQIKEKLIRSRQQRAEKLYGKQIGMIDDWMRNSDLPYTDWEFDGDNLYVYVSSKEYQLARDVKENEVSGLYGIEMYTLSDLVEAIAGFDLVTKELKNLEMVDSFK
ncbi:hypothetical protein [Spirosoma montaniterrae]|uniref:Uncharacterized protein n=1 Tax=Spirosoma montaniterrae TaxID=1178516 RepID=A0A1P9X1Y9_9BACT|nr:hypothetical protein [Spirosoma montaniterrae]AQG81656.1 hypothetical protein AWR27_21510 [Spirosoma montaniterrae]